MILPMKTPIAQHEKPFLNGTLGGLIRAKRAEVGLKQEHIAALQAGRGPISEAAARIATAVMAMYRRQRAEGNPNLHDPLAVSALLSSDILTFEDYHVEIETAGTLTAGESVGWRRSPMRSSAPAQNASEQVTNGEVPFKVNAKVATAVNPEAFFDLLIPRLTQPRV